MKLMKTMITLAIAAVMVLAMSAAVFAAETGTITITPPTNTQSSTTNTYKIYKVFDAVGNGTSISYKLVSGKTTAPDGFTVDSAGNVTLTRTTGDLKQLTADEIAAIAAYVTEADLVDTATSTGTADAVSKALPNGYYYITTSTGSVVTITSTNPSAAVNDKNTVPDVEKKITVVEGPNSTLDTAGQNAVAEVGKKVTYTSTITVGKGSKNLKFHDKMGTGLTYNNDVTVTGVAAGQYTIEPTPDDGDTITISFKDGIAEGTKITVTYTATVNSDALTVDTGKNTATVSYGDNSSSTSDPSETHVYNANLTVSKVKEDKSALKGAGFKLKNSDNLYYTLTNGVVTWTSTGTEIMADGGNGENEAVFTGLGSGDYTLEETTVPEGYNKAADQTITVKAAEDNDKDTDLALTAEVVNKAGAELPSTGGMGTMILYLIGGALVVGAAIALVTRRRMSASK